MDDSAKLKLIENHSKEYYTNGRHFEFIEGAFITYELMNDAAGDAIYYADMYVDKAHRGTSKFRELVALAEHLAVSRNIKIGYCRVEKCNKFLKLLQSMYAGMGFKFLHEDVEALYYKCDRR
jgi:hypothetical protein